MSALLRAALTLSIGILSSPATTTAAQDCQTRVLPVDTKQVGELDPADCRVRYPGNICSDCFEFVPSEYWTVDLATGDLLAIELRPLGFGLPGNANRVRPDVTSIFDPAGVRIVHQGFEADFYQPRFWFRAQAAGTHRIVVGEFGYMNIHYGAYQIRANLVTLPRPGNFTVRFKPATGQSPVSISAVWTGHLSPTPILEYVMEVGSAPGMSDLAILSMGTETGREFSSVPMRTFYARVRARNALGWGQATKEAVFTSAGPNDLFVWSFSGGVGLTWSPPGFGHVMYYELLVGSAPGATDLGVFNVGLPPSYSEWWEPNYRKHDLRVSNVPSGSYYVRVRAMTDQGLTEPSNEASITIR